MTYLEALLIIALIGLITWAALRRIGREREG